MHGYLEKEYLLYNPLSALYISATKCIVHYNLITFHIPKYYNKKTVGELYEQIIANLNLACQISSWLL